MADASDNLVLLHLRELRGSRAKDGRPKAVVCRTRPGKGVRRLGTREKAPLIRVREKAPLIRVDADGGIRCGRSWRRG